MKICFAGFADAEVRALQPALAQISSAWECVFSPEPEDALEKLEAEFHAALVVDLRITGAKGADLLQQTAARHLRTLRFALGDVADREMVANSIGAPFQFISRPWKPAQLIAIIERSLSLDGWLSNDKLRAFIPRLGRLPGLPATYFEVVKRTESPNASVESVAEVVARDPTLSARLLQMVNSAASGLTERITSPEGAVAFLGLDTVKALVLCLQVFNPGPPRETPNLPLHHLWRHSFAVAQLARKLALLHTDDSRISSDAFAAGLLHRIGQILLVTHLACEYGPILMRAREQHHLLSDEELAHLGVNSNQVGAYLLGLWGMPVPLVEAVALYPTPSLANNREFPS
jgi:HD-like signal output (HDOD) protein